MRVLARRRSVFALVGALVSAGVFAVACGLSVVGTYPVSDDDGGDGAPVAVLPEAGKPFVPPDVDVPDATELDAGPSCDEVCDGGCDAGTCVLFDPDVDVTCPPGVPCAVACVTPFRCLNVECGDASACRVECGTGLACNGITVTCGAAPCTVVCETGVGCNAVTVAPGETPSLCLDCGDADGCNAVSCALPPGDAGACVGASCATVTGCGTLTDAAACP